MRKMITIKCKEITVSYDDPVFSISVASRLTKLPVWTLRALDREYVVCPKKTSGNTRLYSNHDLQKLNRVHYLMKVKKMKVGGIRILNELMDVLE